MAIVSLDLPIIGNNNSTEDPKIRSNFSAVQTALNGNLNADNLLPSDADKLGLNYTGVVHQGKSIIDTEESRTNVAFGKLATPDQVSSVVVGTDGLLFVKYSALFKNSVIGAGVVAIFLNSSQHVQPVGTGVPTLVDSALGGLGLTEADDYGWIYTIPDRGTIASSAIRTWNMRVGAGAAARDNTLPMTAGGACEIEIQAGIYDVSVQFKATSGSVTAKQRKLWVWTRGF